MLLASVLLWRSVFSAKRNVLTAIVLYSCVAYRETSTAFLPIMVNLSANNGVPFPKGFDIRQFVKRGAFAGDTGNTGLGGYHVYSIVKRHKGYINLTDSKAWPVIIEVLIPVELYGEMDTDKFVDYGNAESSI